MMQGAPSPEYEGRLRKILADRDWEALREFTRAQNEIPDDVYANSVQRLDMDWADEPSPDDSRANSCH